MKAHFYNTIVFFIFLYWSLAPNFKNVSKQLIVVFFVCSIFFWREMKNDSLRHWALLLALPFLFALFQKLFIFKELDPDVLKTPLRFLYAGASMFMFYKIDAQKLAHALFGVIFGAIGLGVWAYLSTNFEAFSWFDGIRAWDGFSNPIPFGLNAVIFAMLAVSLPHALFPKIPKRLFLALKIIAFAAGLYAAFLSLSRAALFVLPFLAFVLIFQKAKQSKKIVTNILIVGAVLIGALFAVENPYQERIFSGFEEINNPTASMGQRLFLWEEAIDIVRENPAWGVGESGFQNEMRRRLKEYGKTMPSNVIVHPHNDYLTFAVEYGLPGLALVLLFYFAPLAFFIKRLRSNDLIIQTAATCGAMIVTAFAVGGLVDCYFWVRHQVVFYGLSVALFVAMILQVENQQNRQGQKITT